MCTAYLGRTFSQATFRDRNTAVVRLTVFKAGFRWSLEVQDARGNRFIGATASRGQIEALALRLMEEAEAKGDDADMIFAPKHRESRGGPLQGLFRLAG